MTTSVPLNRSWTLTKSKRAIGNLVNTVCLASLAFFAYFYAFETPYLTYENLPFPSQTIAYPGEVVPLQVKRCNASDSIKNYNTTHGLERLDGHNRPRGEYYTLPDVNVSIPPGCSVATSMANRLPDSIPPGRYKLYGTAEIRGLLRSHYVDWYSQPFEVIEKPQGEKP